MTRIKRLTAAVASMICAGIAGAVVAVHFGADELRTLTAAVASAAIIAMLFVGGDDQ